MGNAAIIVLMSLLFMRGQPARETLVLNGELLADRPHLEVETFIRAPDAGLDGVSSPTLQPVADLHRIDVPNISPPMQVRFGNEAPVDRPDFLANLLPQDLLFENIVPTGGGFEGRKPQNRKRLVGERGGNEKSEAAVEMALAWLARHQRDDGSWRFNHLEGRCGGRCRNPGSVETPTGATALALLPFLGAGHTHTDQGEYSEAIDKALYYLIEQAMETPHGADLQQGTMYAQGLAAIALCEAYAMTEDKALRPTAEAALKYIGYAQHPKGGWRYFPGQPGDMTVTGWQMMALKSAQMAQLTVPAGAITRGKTFLNGMATGDGAYYGYLERGKDPAPTAIGLLCRMYTGWSLADGRLANGVAYLADLGPSKDDMYFNYYATQVLHHYGGSSWKPWNEKLRDHLIKTQSLAGHERGSWYFADEHGVRAGRLYNTAMSAMILEVYYRHMPLYGKRMVKE